MIIHFFCNESDKKAVKLFSLIGNHAAENVELRKYVSVEHFEDALHTTNVQGTCVVVAAFQEEALIDAYFINHLLSPCDIMVILPDRNKLSIALGSVLKPKHIFFNDSSFDNIISAIHDSFIRPPLKTMNKQCNGNKKEVSIYYNMLEDRTAASKPMQIAQVL